MDLLRATGAVIATRSSASKRSSYSVAECALLGSNTPNAWVPSSPCANAHHDEIALDHRTYTRLIEHLSTLRSFLTLHVDCMRLEGPMPAAGTTLAILDRETAKFHRDADRCWHHLMESDAATREDYAKQLCTTYGFEAPFEAACAYTPGLSHVIDLRGRARAGLLAQDLLTLGWRPSQITAMQTRTIDPFQDPAEALAWMYVVERPTLLFERVRFQLRARFTDLVRATTYLGAYEHQTSRKWADLGTALDRLCTSDMVRERITSAAIDAFEALITWHRHAPGLRSVG